MEASESIRAMARVSGLRTGSWELSNEGGRGAFPETRHLRPFLLQVLLFQHPPVMQLMSGDDVGECSGADFILVGYAAAQSGLRIEMSKESQGGGADVGEF